MSDIANTFSWDIAVVGGGPAGLSAAVNALARNRRCVIFSRGEETSALYRAPVVNNHLGMPGASGAELLKTYRTHAEASGAAVVKARVTQIIPGGDSFSILAGQDIYEAKAVIIAIGAYRSRRLPGEEAFLGRGVSYCATCDAMLYRGKAAVLLSETEEGVEDARLLAEVCSVLHYFPRQADDERLGGNTITHSGRITGIYGGEYAEGVKTDEGDIPCDGVFLIRPTAPPETLVYGLHTEDNLISVNRHMETNIPGVFACGDCAGKPFQLSNAIGGGLIAGQRAAAHLSEKESAKG